MTDQTATESRKVFVTGATGFLGHHLVGQLVDAGFEVVALVRDPGSEAATRLPEPVKLVQGNVLDAEGVQAAASGCDVACHCAGMVSRDPEDAIAMHAANVEGTQVVLDACKAAGVKRVVYASTSGTVGVSDDPDHVATEGDAPPVDLINRWPYYRSKLYAEQEALSRNDDEFEVVSINPSLLLGPGDLHGSSTTDVRKFLEERLPIAPAGGYSFVDARDAARAMLLAIDAGEAGERYLVTACNCTLRTFFSRVARVAGMEPPVMSLPANKAVKSVSLWLTKTAQKFLGEDEGVPSPDEVDMAQHYWYVDASRAEKDLGWTSRDGMETLADTVADLRSRGIVMMRAAN